MILRRVSLYWTEKETCYLSPTFMTSVKESLKKRKKYQAWLISVFFLFYQAEATSCAQQTTLNPFFMVSYSPYNQELLLYPLCSVLIATFLTISLLVSRFCRLFHLYFKARHLVFLQQGLYFMFLVFYRVVLWKKSIKRGTFSLQLCLW